MIAPAACHGRQTFPGRPPAGTEPWEWWWSSFSKVPRYVGLPGGVAEPDLMGMTHWTDKGPFVTFHYKLTAIQYRVVVAHEMHHLTIGGVCRSRCPRNEKVVVRATARWLLPDVVDLASRLARQSLGSAAIDLGVEAWVIGQRLTYATAKERQAISAVLDRPPTWVTGARAAARKIAAAV